MYKFIALMGFATVVGVAQPLSPTANSSEVNFSQHPITGVSEEPLGARCLWDRQCKSHECKKFKCVQKTQTKAPLGARCAVDGDCESLECKKFRCAPRQQK